MPATPAALILALALASARAQAGQPSSLYPSSPPLYPAAPAYMPTVQPLFVPSPAPQAAVVPLYAPTPMGRPAFGGAPAASVAPPAPSAALPPEAPAAYSQPAPGAPAPARPAAPAAAAAAVQPGGLAVTGQSPGITAAPPQAAAPSTQSYVQATPATLPSDPWRKSQEVLNEISARERDGSLPPEKAVALRAKLQGLRGGSGLHRPADVRRLSASERRYFLNKVKAEDAEVRRDSARP